MIGLYYLHMPLSWLFLYYLLNIPDDHIGISLKNRSPAIAKGSYLLFSFLFLNITADTTVILRLYSVSSGTFPTRRFTVSSM